MNIRNSDIVRRNRTILFLLTLILSFCLFACSGSTEDYIQHENKAEITTSEHTIKTAKYELMSGDNIYNIVLMSDTQFYSKSKADVYYAMVDYLVDNKEEKNFEYVIHTGDLTENCEDVSQWQVASIAMSKLDDNIPYGVLAGNHDQSKDESKRFAAYAAYFGSSRYDGRTYFESSYENCRAMCQLVTVGNTDFVVVYMSDNPDAGCIAFANESLKKYSDRIGILCVHNYLNKNIVLSEAGKYINESIVKCNANVYMVLCGHELAAGLYTSEFDDDGDGMADRTVCQIIADYQVAGNDGCMMFLQMNEKDNTLTGISYSPVTGKYAGYQNMNTGEFKIEIPWTNYKNKIQLQKGV